MVAAAVAVAVLLLLLALVLWRRRSKEGAPPSRSAAVAWANPVYDTGSAADRGGTAVVTNPTHESGLAAVPRRAKAVGDGRGDSARSVYSTLGVDNDGSPRRPPSSDYSALDRSAHDESVYSTPLDVGSAAVQRRATLREDPGYAYPEPPPESDYATFRNALAVGGVANYDMPVVQCGDAAAAPLGSYDMPLAAGELAAASDATCYASADGIGGDGTAEGPGTRQAYSLAHPGDFGEEAA